MMDNMKDKFAQFSGISIMLVSASMTLFTRLVDGYYELKNVLSIIINLLCNIKPITYIIQGVIIILFAVYIRYKNRSIKG